MSARIRLTQQEADQIGGIIAALYALRILQDLNFKDYAQITLLLNSNEETGSLGTRLLIEKLAKEHDATLNLEAGRPGDGLVVWRKGSGAIKVEVKGRAAHAGVAPDNGRNAAMELAHQATYARSPLRSSTGSRRRSPRCRRTSSFPTRRSRPA